MRLLVILSFLLSIMGGNCGQSPTPGPGPQPGPDKLKTQAATICEALNASVFQMENLFSNSSTYRAICTIDRPLPTDLEVSRRQFSCKPGAPIYEEALALASSKTNGFSATNFDDCVAKVTALKGKLGQKGQGPEIAKAAIELATTGACSKVFSPQRGANESCQSPTDCKNGLACVFESAASTNRVCKPRIAAVKDFSNPTSQELIDNACDEQRQYRVCVETAECQGVDATHSVCRASDHNVLIADGQPCGNPQKNLGYKCQNPCFGCIKKSAGDPQICQPYQSETADCYRPITCKADLLCDVIASGKCIVPKTSGACGLDEECAKGYWCKANQCVPQVTDGTCSNADIDTAQCSVGRCVNQKCSPLNEGAPCAPGQCLGSHLACNPPETTKPPVCVAIQYAPIGESCVNAYLKTVPADVRDQRAQALKDPAKLVDFIRNAGGAYCSSGICDATGICKQSVRNQFTPSVIANALVYGTLAKQ